MPISIPGVVWCGQVPLSPLRLQGNQQYVATASRMIIPWPSSPHVATLAAIRRNAYSALHRTRIPTLRALLKPSSA